MTRFAQRTAEVGVYLAAMGSTTILGVMLGTIGHLFWPEASRFVLQAAAGTLGFGLGAWWCATVGRRWLRAEGAEPHPHGGRSGHDPFGP